MLSGTGFIYISISAYMPSITATLEVYATQFTQFGYKLCNGPKGFARTILRVAASRFLNLHSWRYAEWNKILSFDAKLSYSIVLRHKY